MHLKTLSALFLPFLLSSVLAAPAPKNHENANGALQARQEPEVYPPEGYANWGDYFETFDGDSEITPGAALKVRAEQGDKSEEQAMADGEDTG